MTKRLLWKQTNKQTVNWKRKIEEARVLVTVRRDGGEEAGAITRGLSLLAVSSGYPDPCPGLAVQWAGGAGAAHRESTLGCRGHLLGEPLGVMWIDLLRLEGMSELHTELITPMSTTRRVCTCTSGEHALLGGATSWWLPSWLEGACIYVCSCANICVWMWD